MENRIENLVTMMDGYFTKGAHHLNVNVLNREMLEDAMEHPEKIPATYYPRIRLCRKFHQIEP